MAAQRALRQTVMDMDAGIDIDVRLATPADAAVLADLANALDRDQGGHGRVHSPDTVLNAGFGGDPVVQFVIAVHAQVGMGYAMFSRFYNSDKAQTGSYLNDLYVVPALRRTGTGLQLLAAVAAETARRGGAFIWTGVYEMNAGGRAFYRAIGARDENARILEIDGEAFQMLVRRKA